MALTKEQRQEAMAKARAAKAAKAEPRLEAAADVSRPEPRSQAGFAETAEVDPTSYVYVGGLGAVVVSINATSYEFRAHQPVHLARPDAGLDEHPDFVRWEGDK